MRKRNSGVSLLLEALLGIGIFGTAMLVVFGLFPSTHQSITQARRYAEATNLAKEYVDAAEADGFPSTDLDGDGVPDFDSDGDGIADALTFTPAPALITSTVDGVNVETLYDIKVDREVLDPTVPQDMRARVTVTVSWSEHTAGSASTTTRQVRLETVLAPRGG